MLGTSYKLVHHHPSNGLSVLFLLRRVNPMSLGIHGEAMDSVLNAKVFQFAVVVWIILMENGNGAAVTRDINATKAKIKLDHIGSIGNSQKGDCSVLIQIKDCHHI